MLLKAIYDLAGKEKVDKVVLHYSVGSGFYFTMAGEQKLDQAFLDQVKKRMTELVEQKIPVKKRSVGTDEAIALFIITECMIKRSCSAIAGFPG